MVFTYEDKVIIRYLRQKFGHGPKKIIDDHPEYNWNIHGLKTLLANIDKTGEIERKEGSGRPRTVRTEENIEAVEDDIESGG